jgi:hypothetical protein
MEYDDDDDNMRRVMDGKAAVSWWPYFKILYWPDSWVS